MHNWQTAPDLALGARRRSRDRAGAARSKSGQDERARPACGAFLRQHKVVDGIDTLPDENAHEIGDGKAIDAQWSPAPKLLMGICPQGLLVCSNPARKCLCIEGIVGALRRVSQVVFHLPPPSSVLDLGGKVGGARRQHFQEGRILARKCYWMRRNRLGVMPNFWRNRVVKCEWLEKPLSRAISVRAVGAYSSRRRACSRRSPCRY